MLVVAVALLVLAIVRRTRIGASGIVAAIGVFVTTGAAYVLGRLLAWDGLGLHAVVNDVAGVDGALDPSVFVIGIDGRQVSPSTYEVWAWSHLGLSALVVLALVISCRPGASHCSLDPDGSARGGRGRGGGRDRALVTYTGSLLPWDQLALWAVTVGPDSTVCSRPSTPR